MNEQLQQHENGKDRATGDGKSSPRRPRSPRRSAVLGALGIATSSWYHTPTPDEKRRKPGPKAKPIAPEVEEAVLTMAKANPWYGYKRIAVMCRRQARGQQAAPAPGGQRRASSNSLEKQGNASRRAPHVKNRDAYRVMKKHGLLQKKQPREAELYQAKKLWELLPQRPNDLWQMDVTYIHIAGYGWWYAVTVIDYYSRYLLALRFTDSYSAIEVTAALADARREAERIHGPLLTSPFIVTDNGPSFLANRFTRFVADDYTHVRIAYRTPTQLGLLERFHQTLKREEVYWQLYDSPAHARASLAAFRERYNTQRPHWALIPDAGGDTGSTGGDPLTPQDVYEHGLTVQIPRWQEWATRAKEQLDQMLDQDAA